MEKGDSVKDNEENITSAALFHRPAPKRSTVWHRQCGRHLFAEPHDWLDVKDLGVGHNHSA